MEEGSCRQAYEEFQHASSFGAAGANAKQKDALECGTIKIAFVEFDNKTGRTIAGMDMGDVIFEKIRTKTQAKASTFIRMMDRQQLNLLLREMNGRTLSIQFYRQCPAKTILRLLQTSGQSSN